MRRSFAERATRVERADAGIVGATRRGRLASMAARTYVGIGFAIPKAGECATWRGFCSSGCSPDNVQTGVACTASNGSHVSFGLTIFYLASNRQFDWIRLDLPSETGSGNFNYENPALGTTNYSAKGATCPAEPVR